MTLLLGMLLDALLGEPRWLWSRLPHPAVLMGRAVGWIDTRFNTGDRRKRNGTLGLAALCLGAALLGLALMAVPGSWVDVIVLAILLAQRSLVDHVRAVATGLRAGLAQGRTAVAMIVGRETATLSEPATARAAIESAAENLSDGVVAPAFWFAVAGLPGLLVYKITNTADSMIGYRTPKYADFGWAAARFDDLLNWVPARLTAALIWATTPSRRSIAPIIAEAPLHRSPNAGWPEAAMAHVLGIALSGPRSYDGALRDYPFVNPDGRHLIGPPDIDRACRTLWLTWGLAVFATVIVALF
ncbi:adenosylcobinamide-phosphate synthase [Loktanella sp. DSM 29012]|uniref:adenosylcobinamide-phosphate synthase CbiB n=1 Tax=Loktanella sp. DSM 29012 TaxID=1881056 RepID=UPI0008C479AF|nr:adenosylcobinamide-phosphate synthase CbiB [Loktanella sp. DSM 29012]SEP80273.1 adenosylcobinamide-phosphate synthase [Loktanella sp. DSM 29012]